MHEDDLFANFERMRRQLDELFGDVGGRFGVTQRRRAFTPKVDVYYVGDPPVAVITADLAGIDVGDVEIEVQGRHLVIAGRRRPAQDERRLYQQIEIEHGGFRRVIELGADVVADAATANYDDGLLRIELPLAAPEKVHLTPVHRHKKIAKPEGER